MATHWHYQAHTGDTNGPQRMAYMPNPSDPQPLAEQFASHLRDLALWDVGVSDVAECNRDHAWHFGPPSAAGKE